METKIQSLVTVTQAGDTARLDVLKELRKHNLFLKEDIKEYDLLFWLSFPAAKMRFEYLAELDPDYLITSNWHL